MVNLVLDNSDRLLPVDSDEISITRKLYRSGESEYRLGGASVRLKDIYELFMDTGLGRDGYSVIGQGRIAEIISSRSSERREIFEEAAGISKYRYRRGEAQRRLDAAEENMLRLRDILSELEGRVEPLRKEAEKAREYLALADERRTLEIGVWLAKIDQLSAQYRELQDKFLAARGEYDSLAREEEGMEERINLLYTQMQDCAVTADGLRTRLREWEAEAAQIRSDQAVGENNIAHSRESIASLEAEHRQGLEHTDADQAAAAEAEKRIAALEQAGEEIRSRLTEETARAQQNEKQLARAGRRDRIPPSSGAPPSINRSMMPGSPGRRVSRCWRRPTAVWRRSARRAAAGTGNWSAPAGAGGVRGTARRYRCPAGGVPECPEGLGDAPAEPPGTLAAAGGSACRCTE